MSFFKKILCLCISYPLAAATLVHDKTYSLREAHTSEEIEKGLMHVTDLNQDSGMIFIMKKPQIVSFWMKDTPLPLDILFINSSKEIIDIHHAIPFSLEKIVSSEPVLWVLELKAGLAKDLNLKIHDKVTIYFDGKV